ncbi:ribonucleoside triphosphate reductase [Candidatus Micrarchaeota archaeon]|nr:ribonucleoside triphosphate reductase [Candidatus Micrarchaeota archaeon]
MVSQVQKRDGKYVLYNPKKIVDAIWKALDAAGEGEISMAEKLGKNVEDILNIKYGDKYTPSVENVQDVVEEVLMINGYTKAAKAYILYRKQHQDLRNLAILIGNSGIVESYLNKSDWRVKENANMSYSLQGLNNHIAGTIVANYWLDKLYPEKISKAHKSGELHIHDLSTLGTYCVGWDLRDVLMTGFTGAPDKIQSKPAKHLRVALGQIVNFFYTLQGESAGAQAFSNFDTYLAPFIRYDGIGYKEVKQAMQEFMSGMNVPTRVGFQTPFTNITMDMDIPNMMKNDPIVIGGKIMDDTYGDFQEEMDIFNRAFSEVVMEGDAKGRVFTFPIPTYNITKGFDWEREQLKPIFEMTAKYGIPYFSNFINSDMNPEDTRSMCCRLRLDNRELRKRGGGLFGANPLTGSIGVVTLNMPRIGYLSKNEDQYFEMLAELMDVAKESLILKRKVLEKFTESGLYPYSKFYLRNVKEQNKEYWKNHFGTIGLIGMNESLINLFGEQKDLIDNDARTFAIKVLDFMRDKLSEYQSETNSIFNLEATPGEGTSHRLARLDKSEYKDIIVANENQYQNNDSPPYYTNSTQLHVATPLDLFEALELQDPLQTRYTGGTVFHTFLGEKINDWKVVRNLVRKIAENYKLPYYTITPTFSVCPVHGYIPGEHNYCPKCDAEIGYTQLKQKMEVKN